ncbi:DNA repair and recombination protein [Colletotrichum musicola]|uniref:ATP-dependent DNA helicase n=1 Tax=Colletotrichum musicola TaxID=2175873 RepID=A0A8H6ML71_9PEZI|nr:DNA repair and recombination protein [Colletotrichum musicola]
MNKAVFPKIQEIVKNLTTEAIQEAVEELSATRTTTNPDIQLLLRETNAFGKRQHMSNEERLFSRRKIQSLCVQFGMPCVWYTINPNDLTNPVNMKLATFRVARSEAERTKLFADFKRNFGGRVQHVVKDAVSSAQFFHREIELFFKHLVAVGEESIFGKVSSYFGCIETNERGALHIHGLLWLDANMELPKLFDDLEADKTGTYAAQSCDVQRAMSYRRFDSVFSDIVDITQDMVKFAEDFDNEVNMVVHRCQMHSCGATCTKYSYKDKERRKGGKRSLCRFHAPWCLRCKTEITPEGILHIRRNHERINRFSAALAVALRHNHDVAFLPTNAAGLAMIYYATNYSTKLDNPLWKRVALMSIVLEGIAKQEEELWGMSSEDPDTAQRNCKGRQFLARWANRIFTSRELSAVEVCANLLGYKNSYCNMTNDASLLLTPLYCLANAYPHRGPVFRDICFYEYVSLVSVQQIKKRNRPDGKGHVAMADTLPDYECWVQALYEGDRAIPVLTGYLNSDPTTTDDGYYRRYVQARNMNLSTNPGRSAVILLALFVPWEDFTHITDRDPIEVWKDHQPRLPDRIKGYIANIRLLHKTAEDAKKDAKLWASRSEGDQGIEFEEADDTEMHGEGWEPLSTDVHTTFHELVSSLHTEAGIVQGSPHLKNLVGRLDEQDTASDDGNSASPVDQRFPDTIRQRMTMPKKRWKSVKASQQRLHKERMLAIEGDEPEMRPIHTGAETGFGDGDVIEAAMLTPPPTQQPEQARAWVEVGPDDSFLRAGRLIGDKRTLNRMQKVALGLICEALDKRVEGGEEQHLQYIGGGGGTGKSWLIDTLKEVFVAKDAANKIVITATSGTAAAGIGGTTIHSAVGISFSESDGKRVDPMSGMNSEKAKERWRRRDVLVIDEASMLGLVTLREVDERLRVLRGFSGKPFGGIPVVIFTGDFLQFAPVNQTSLLGDTDKGNKKAETRFKEKEAQKLWRNFTNVVLLQEQKRAQGDTYLTEFLTRLRDGKQTNEDADRLASRYKQDSRFDFTGDRRGIIPLNQDRWSLTLHAALAFSIETGRRLTIYLSGHYWKDRIPAPAERILAMQLGDGSKLPIPAIFPYVEGMPVVVNENVYMGLRVVNGAEFTAVGIAEPPGREEIHVSESISIVTGPPNGILLRSNATKHLNYKAQGRSMTKTLLGLYGRKRRAATGALDKCDAISMYVQLSRARTFDGIALIEPLNKSYFLEARMPPHIVDGMRNIAAIATRTVAEFEGRHGPQI